MKISQISKIKNCRTFVNFAWPAELSPFQDYNLIYGWNGTGKTTIADVLRAIERKKHSFDGEFIVETDAKTIKSDGLTEGWEEQKPPIRVFNRAYVEENIFSTDGDAITPIFFLGEENVEKQKLVESKTRLRQEKNEKYLAKIAEKDKKERELETLYVRGAKAVKDVLLSGGNNPYKNYNRGDFKPKIESLIASGNDAAFYYESDEERAALKARFSGSNKAVSYTHLTLPTNREV